MGLKELEAEIREKGRTEISKIREEANARTKEIEGEINKEIEKRSKEILQKGERESVAVERRILAEAKLKAKNTIEIERIRILDRVFEEARKDILNLPNSKKTAILKNLIDDGKKEIANPTVYVDKRYKELVSGVKAKDLEDFGIVLESEDGSLIVDNTLSAKLENLRLILTPDIVKILFEKSRPGGT